MLRTAARILLSALGRPEEELTVVLVGDRRIAALNRQFLGRAGPTNVIAFPLHRGHAAAITPRGLGDVVVSADTAGREALHAGLALETRLIQLLVHGVLHLCGYDHERDPREARRMQAKSRQLVRRIAAGMAAEAGGALPADRPKPPAGPKRRNQQHRRS